VLYFLAGTAGRERVLLDSMDGFRVDCQVLERLMKKNLPIGISDFKDIIDGDYAYVDKSLLIEELMLRGTAVALIPRMRRFGKTLNLSMLRYFFEKRESDTSYLFKNLNIWKKEKYRLLQGKFPVVFLTLKDVKQPSFEQMFKSLHRVVTTEYIRHRYLLEGETLSAEEKEFFYTILKTAADTTLLEESLLRLTEWLSRYHKTKVILLIDEYDTPAHSAFVGGFYATLIPFMRNWLSAGLKDNGCIERAVLTGILRITKESIFSGLNNESTFTILDEEFQDKFGLLESEVAALLREYDLSDTLPAMREWYNGYRIGSCPGIYNPWSVLKCIAKNGTLLPFWVNTSDNALMKQLIAKGGEELKVDLEELLRGGIIEKKIDEGIAFPALQRNTTAIWSLLLYSGYLSLDSTPSFGVPCRLRIPNFEVRALYQSMVLDWFTSSIEESKYHALLESLTSGDVDTFSKIFQHFMLSSVSVFDVPAEESEKIYHAFVLGMLIGLKETHEVKSNRESGYGRYDVMVIPKNPKNLGIIMEFKKNEASEKVDLETTAQSAMKQIVERKYCQELHDRGIERVLYLAFAFKGKEVLIRSKFE
jgi:hypothetical protein